MLQRLGQILPQPLQDPGLLCSASLQTLVSITACSQGLPALVVSPEMQRGSPGACHCCSVPTGGGWPARRAAVQPGYAILCPHAWCEPAARSAGDETRECGADPSSPAAVRTRGHARAAAMRRQDAAG